MRAPTSPLLRVLPASTAALAVASCIMQVPPANRRDDAPPAPSEPACVYPDATGIEGVGSILPPLTWTVAVAPGGRFTTLQMEDVYCRRAPFENIETVFFVLVAEWCPNCPQYARDVGARAPDLEAENALVVFVDLQAADQQTLPSTESAEGYVLRYTDQGWRVGEADNAEPGALYEAPIWSAVPGCFVVRTRDMQIIANQEDSQYILPFEDIAADPEADWSNPPPPSFRPNCAAADEEPGEPNDTAATATPLVAGTPVEGGICTAAPDYFTVDIAGEWRLDLLFTHAEGDLDVYVVDPVTGDPILENNRPVGSEGTTDRETFTRTGPAMIGITGFQGSSTTYTLTVTALSTPSP
ncbi:MAG: hypothetical protein FJ137_12530 [Deltaproteobacteria bacterium]|nr:hypothetical protein [Deltaproteobacteria bacterium]